MHIKITEEMHLELKNHLHNGDGLEALAFALCGRLEYNKDSFLLVHNLFLVPYDKCDRTEVTVSWKTEDVQELLEECYAKGWGLIKLHSHFVNNSDFSELDDNSDKSFFEGFYGWMDNDLPNASVIMYPDGSMKGRTVTSDLSFEPVQRISVVGEEIKFFDYQEHSVSKDEFFTRNLQAFGSKTTQQLKKMKIGVVGCSGTGSPLIEMLFRLGVGTLVIVDPDIMGKENLNRIVSSKLSDAEDERFKVDVIEEYIKSVDIGTEVVKFPCLLQESRDVVNELASCDFLFGTVDSVEGRHYLNQISTYYLIPLIDVGVRLSADGKGSVDSIIGNVDYVFPNSKTLLERGVYTQEQLAKESLRRVNEEEFIKRQAYFDNVEMPSPAVISVNSTCSTFAVNEMLGRIHPYRYSSNSRFSRTVINLSDWDINNYPTEMTKDTLHSKNIGVGRLEPNLNIYEIS